MHHLSYYNLVSLIFGTTIPTSLTLGVHAQEGYCSRPVCVCVCLSVKSHLTSGASVRPENTVTYSAGNRGQKICGGFSKTVSLWRSSTPPLKAICSVSHFSAKSAHSHYSIRGHEYPCRGFWIHSIL